MKTAQYALEVQQRTFNRVKEEVRTMILNHSILGQLNTQSLRFLILRFDVKEC